jgi:hypothetical protein
MPDFLRSPMTAVTTARFRCIPILISASLALFIGAAGAQDLPPGVRLGMTADELRAAVPETARIARPQRLAGGLTGNWRGPATRIAEVDFGSVFYFAGDRLKRVEYVATTATAGRAGTADDASMRDRGETAFAALVDWGRTRFGSEMRSNDPGSAYAAWAQGDTDIYAQRTFDAQSGTVRLVYRMRQLKDGRTL